MGLGIYRLSHDKLTPQAVDCVQTIPNEKVYLRNAAQYCVGLSYESAFHFNNSFKGPFYLASIICLENKRKPEI